MDNPKAFAENWCAAWNTRDAERVLAHFHDDVVFSSPLAARLLPETGGVVNGKAALRAYWALGLAAYPDLFFTVEDVFAGVDALTIQYRNEAGQRIAETLLFSAGKVKAGHVTVLA